MILDGIAGAVAANTVIKTAVAMSGLTSILTWLVWAIFIYVIGVKLFPDKKTNVPFKKVLTAVGFAHAPGLLISKPGAWANPTAVNTFLKGTFVFLSGKSLTPIT